MGAGLSTVWSSFAEWWWGNLMRTELSTAEHVFILGRPTRALLREAGE